jgi:Flp pilus assembly protein TadG
MPHPTTSPRRRHDTGSAAVEFALMAPLLLLLVFGIVAYGYMLSFRQALSQGATEGARAAAVSAYPTQSQKVTDAVSGVNDALGGYGVQCAIATNATTGTLRRDGVAVGSCTVSPATCVNNALASCMSVQITYDYQNHPLVPEVPGVGLVLPNSLSYTAVAQVG